MLKEKLGSAFSFLDTTAPPLIGVDIRSTALKLVELAESGKGAYRLERYAIEPLPKDVVTDGNIANLDQVAEALRRGHKRLGSRNRNVALALPAAMVITKKIIVPAGQTEEELELQVETEANQYIPFALDEVNLDFQILGPAPNNPEEVESAKKNAGLPENYDVDVLQPFMETLALEVTRALQFFFTSTSYNQVDQIVLSGGCALVPGLDELVAKRAGANTIVGNPFANMGVSDRIRPRQLAADAPVLLIG